MPQPLRSIAISGYKSIRDATVELRALNVLVGANGAGKSNFISAFGFLHDLVEQRLRLHVGRRGGASELLHLGPPPARRLAFELDFGTSGYAVALSPSDLDAFVFDEELYWVREPGGEPVVEDLRSAGQPESGLREHRGVSDHARVSVESWRVFHFHDTSASAPLKQKQPIDDNRFLRANAENLAPVLHRIRETDPHSYGIIVGTVRGVAPSFDDFQLAPDPLNPRYIQLQWRAKGSDTVQHAHALSDGTLRFICLATLLTPPPDLPTTVLLDEPELGLHPSALCTLAAMVDSGSTRTQIILSTQSVTLMNHFEAEHIVVVDRNNAEPTTFRRVSAEGIARWSAKYSLGDLWERNVIGGLL